MSFISRDEFLKMQAEKEQTTRPQGPRVGYFSLRDDGDETLVRFAYSDPSEFEVYTVHPVTIDGRFRKVNCINDLRAGVHSCPLCAAGVQLQQKFYIRLIEYTRDDLRDHVNSTLRDSLYKYDISVNENDKFLSLNTCTAMFGDEDDIRITVNARLVREGEKIKLAKIEETAAYKEVEKIMEGGDSDEETDEV